MEIGVVFRPDLAPEELLGVVGDAEAAGVSQLWLWEDCFLHGGVATAASALARSENLQVGMGLFPVPLRNPAVTAMEFASLARLFPGRFLPVLGHGVLDWMGQVGARAESPMTLLRESTLAVRDLLAGETVRTDGRYVTLDDVTLDHPPAQVPPVLVGARGRKTLQLAGEVGDGVLLDSGLSPEQVADALATVALGEPGPGFRRVGYLAAPDPDAVADVVPAYGEAGLDTVVLVPPPEAPDPRPWFGAATGS
ncbi:LLM class flavin-dependent oxidoreductase [Pseudonocardia phyllosphaerae]|uniref:LLM class flavin-dependent oxidoreductase n=1 Tax=Pseudonocardia phyllosphaerae TaxID=3390502 RepID=UPI00397BC72F